MLAGIVLSDVDTASAGNLVVWPGSHRVLERYFRERGPKSLLSGMPAVDLGPPEPVLARAGDVVLCHYQLAHAAGPNTSPRVRYAVYFRLKARGHDDRRWECLTDVSGSGPAVSAPDREGDLGRALAAPALALGAVEVGHRALHGGAAWRRPGTVTGNITGSVGSR